MQACQAGRHTQLMITLLSLLCPVFDSAEPTGTYMSSLPSVFRPIQCAVLCSWAVKSILMGYGFLPTPSNKYELFNNPTVSTWLTWPGEISHSDVTWVGYVGKFKSHWALLKPSEPPPKVSYCPLLLLLPLLPRLFIQFFSSSHSS